MYASSDMMGHVASSREPNAPIRETVAGYGGFGRLRERVIAGKYFIRRFPSIRGASGEGDLDNA